MKFDLIKGLHRFFIVLAVVVFIFFFVGLIAYSHEQLENIEKATIFYAIFFGASFGLGIGTYLIGLAIIWIIKGFVGEEKKSREVTKEDNIDSES